MNPIEQRKKESIADYHARCARWHRWLAQEPTVDLWLVDDTEVAEYRAWAGTTGLHRRRVEELMEMVS